LLSFYHQAKHLGFQSTIATSGWIITAPNAPKGARTRKARLHRWHAGSSRMALIPQF
jgi:hypothetical protein